MAGSLRMVEERIVSDRVERRKSFEDSFLLFRDRPGCDGERDRVGGEIYTRNLCGISFRSFTEREPQSGDSGGKGKKGGRFCTRQKRRERVRTAAAEEKRGAGKRGGHTRRDTRRRREAKRKGSITHIHPLYPSGSLSSLPPNTLESLSAQASKQASNQLPVT